MSNIKKFLEREIEEYLRNVDFTNEKMEYLFNEESLNQLDLPERLHDYLKEIINRVIQDIVEGASRRFDEITEDIIDQIDVAQLSDELGSKIESKTLSYDYTVHITDTICPSCYRMYGEWKSKEGNILTESEINKKGMKIVILDDLK